MRRKLRRILRAAALCVVLAGSLRISASAAAFQDVPADHWAAASVQRCVEKGFFNGQSETRFGVGQKMSRSAFAVVLCRFFGWETAVSAEWTSPDVPLDAWYAGAVQAAYEHGAVTDQRDVFRPEDPITREELAVMLVRALGYGEIAGLSQDLPMPFQDVTTNAGYITMAYDLGLVSGTTAATFSPDNTATREQVAVILMRLYDKLHGEDTETIGVVSADSDMTGLEIAAIPAVRAFAMSMKVNLEPEAAAAVQAAAREAGAKAFLYMEAGTAALGSNPEQMSKLMAEAAVSGGYDGLMLDLPKVPGEKRRELNKLVKAVDKNLGGLPFYLVVEAPTREGKVYDGYHYETLAASVDRLVLKASGVEEKGGPFVMAPVDPMEEIYYAVASVREQVGVEKLAVMLQSEMDYWVDGSRFELSEAYLAELLAAKTTQTYYSERYQCAYLTGTGEKGKPLTAWYLTREGVEARVRLAKGLGVRQVCVSDWDAATTAFLAGLN